MNAIPAKKKTLLTEAIDELFVSFGARKVLFEVTARLFRKVRLPDTAEIAGLHVFGMSDHIRKDIGLPPESDSPLHINPVVLHMLNRF